MGIVPRIIIAILVSSAFAFLGGFYTGLTEGRSQQIERSHQLLRDHYEKEH